MKSKLKWLSILFAFVICLGGFGFSKLTNYAYAADEYTVTFHHLDSSTTTQTTVEGLVTEPADSAEEGYRTHWYYVDENNNEIYFDFNTVITSDTDLYARAVRYYTVSFYEYTDISLGLESTDYTLISTQSIMTNSYATRVDASVETGYDFLYWTDNYETKTEFVFDQNRITQDVNLYPVYKVQTFTITYLVDDEVYTTQTVNYNTQTSKPTQPTKDGYIFENWYILDQTSTTLFDFDTTITQDYTLVARFESAAYTVTYTTSSYVTFSGDAEVLDGQDLTFYVTLGNSYNQTVLTLDHLVITGEYEVAELEKESNRYKVVLYGVTSEITVASNALQINKYSVTLPTVTGLDFTIVTNSNNYTYDGTKYTLDYGKSFEFSVSTQQGYYAKALSFTNVYSSGTKFTVSTNSADVTIKSNCQVVEYVDVTMSGTENMTYTFSTAILEQDDNNFKIEKGISSKFTATASEGYFLKTVSGANLVSGEYVFTADQAKTISFEVVSYKTVTLPTVTGILSYSVQGQLSNSDNDYYVQDGQSIVVVVNLLSNYSESIVSLSAGEHVVTSNVANTFTINNITADCQVVITGVTLNSLSVTFGIDNTIAQVQSDSQEVVYGQDYTFTLTLTNAYNKSSLSKDNISIDGQYINVEVDGNQVIVRQVLSDITVQLIDVELNIYTINLVSNDYGTLNASPLSVTHGANTTLTASIAAKYNQSVLVIQYLDITGTYVSHSQNNGEVTLVDVQQDLTIALKDIPVNYYRLSLPASENNEFGTDKPSQNVAHGSSFTFTLTLASGYTQNIDSLKLYVNSEELIGVKNGYSATYTLTNIVEDKVMTTSVLVINSYVVSYQDGDNVLFIRNENYGATPTRPTNGVKIGYEFAGWYLDKNLTTEFDFDNYVISSDISVYAKFVIMEFTINFEIDGSVVDFVTVYYGTDISDMLPEIPQKVGYKKIAPYWDFATAGVNQNSITKDATVVAVYTIDTYRVTFVARGVVIDTQYVEYLSDAVAPSNTDITGYTFEGWDNVFTSVIDDIVVNGIYEIISYKVYFVDVNAGTTIYSQSVDYNLTADRPSDNYVLSGRVGYTVYGWYKDEGLSQIFDFSTKITQDVYVYGDIDITVLNVNFIVDGTLYDTYQVNYGEDLATVPAVPSKVGYTQVEPTWSVDNFTNITDDIECEAIYTINVYTVTFVYPDGTEFVTTAHHGETITNLPNKNLRFGQQLSASKKQLSNITTDITVQLKVNDYLWLIITAIVVVCGGLITLIIIFSIKIKKNRGATTNSKDVEAIQQKLEQRQAYIDRMEKKE